MLVFFVFVLLVVGWQGVGGSTEHINLIFTYLASKDRNPIRFVSSYKLLFGRVGVGVGGGEEVENIAQLSSI
jgi:hypothetical protein